METVLWVRAATEEKAAMFFDTYLLTYWMDGWNRACRRSVGMLTDYKKELDGWMLRLGH